MNRFTSRFVMPAIRLGAETLSADQILADLNSLGKLTPMLKDIAINKIVVTEMVRFGIEMPKEEDIDRSLSIFRHELGLVDEQSWSVWLEQSGQQLSFLRTHISVSLKLQALAAALGLEPLTSLYERQASSLAKLTVSYLCSPYRHAIDKAVLLINEGNTSFEQLHNSLRKDLGLPIQFVRQTLSQGDFRNVVLEAISNLDIGEFSEPVECAGQWHILRLEDRLICNLDLELQEKLLRDQIVNWAIKQLPDVLEVA